MLQSMVSQRAGCNLASEQQTMPHYAQQQQKCYFIRGHIQYYPSKSSQRCPPTPFQSGKCCYLRFGVEEFKVDRFPVNCLYSNSWQIVLSELKVTSCKSHNCTTKPVVCKLCLMEPLAVPRGLSRLVMAQAWRL